LFETLTWSQIGNHQNPVGLLNVNNYYIPLLAAMDHAVREGFVFKEHRDAVFVAGDQNQLLNAMSEYEHSHEAVKKWLRE
jgi:predicted Rossmann-fold nucleotide-binding protein